MNKRRYITEVICHVTNSFHNHRDASQNQTFEGPRPFRYTQIVDICEYMTSLNGSM